MEVPWDVLYGRVETMMVGHHGQMYGSGGEGCIIMGRLGFVGKSTKSGRGRCFHLEELLQYSEDKVSDDLTKNYIMTVRLALLLLLL